MAACKIDFRFEGQPCINILKWDEMKSINFEVLQEEGKEQFKFLTIYSKFVSRSIAILTHNKSVGTTEL